MTLRRLEVIVAVSLRSLPQRRRPHGSFHGRALRARRVSPHAQHRFHPSRLSRRTLTASAGSPARLGLPATASSRSGGVSTPPPRYAQSLLIDASSFRSNRRRVAPLATTKATTPRFISRPRASRAARLSSRATSFPSFEIITPYPHRQRRLARSPRATGDGILALSGGVSTPPPRYAQLLPNRRKYVTCLREQRGSKHTLPHTHTHTHTHTP